MNEKALVDCGLTSEQAKIYLLLLEHGLANAKVISSKTNIGRALVYKVLDQLIALKLVEKREDIGKIALFSPGHPGIIKNLIDNKKSEIILASKSVDDIFGLLSSKYNALQGKPNINYLEGIQGLNYAFEDILDINQDIKIISSPIEYEYREKVLEIIDRQTDRQAKNNINTQAITPRDLINKKPLDVDIDKKKLITRKLIPKEKMNIPAQIIICGDKTFITSFKETIITVTIESKYISETMRAMFDHIWNSI